MNQLFRLGHQPMVSILRIITGLLFLEHGLMKLVHFPIAQPDVPPHLPPLLLAAAAIETVGGTLVALGLFTRLAAWLCAGEMAVAYVIAHLPHGIWPAVNGGELAILYCFIFLLLVFAGPGAWSIDGLLRASDRRRTRHG